MNNDKKNDGITVKFNVIKKRGSKCVTTRLLADYSNKMIDHHSEWNGGYDPVKDGHPLLPKGSRTVSVEQPKIQQTEQSQTTSNTDKLCTCLSRDLFHFGCRCGGK